jgi:flagellar P-ring protein precursor FlgI
LTLNLRNNDFSTAQRISRSINEIYPASAAVADAGTIRVEIPVQVPDADIVGFIDRITSAEVVVDAPAVVVINEKTGTIVVGQNVGISAVAISQGSLVVKIKETPIVSQPTAPFSDAGETKVVQETAVSIEEKEGFLIPVPKTVTVAELAKTLNAIGATPRDLIAIFNALKKAGALQARLEIM